MPHTVFFKRIPSLLFTTLVLISCKTAQPTEMQTDVTNMVSEKLGNRFDSSLSPAGEFMLCVQKSGPAGDNTLRFLVVHLKNKEVMVEQTFVPGHVKWISDSSIELLSLPGTIRENEDLSDYIRIIDIRTLKNK